MAAKLMGCIDALEVTSVFPTPLGPTKSSELFSPGMSTVALSSVTSLSWTCTQAWVSVCLHWKAVQDAMAHEQLSFDHAGFYHISEILSDSTVPLLPIRIPSEALVNAEDYMLKAGSEGHFINPTPSDI